MKWDFDTSDQNKHFKKMILLNSSLIIMLHVFFVCGTFRVAFFSFFFKYYVRNMVAKVRLSVGK